MSNNAVFNAAVCLMGIVILFVHITSLLIKKKRRTDENYLLAFFVFTVIHFATYLTFTFIKANYTSDPFITAFYTTFYIMNNGEALLLFAYVLHYVTLFPRTKRTLTITGISLFAIFVALDIVNVFAHMFFYAEAGEYVRTPWMIFSQGYQLIMLGIVMLIALINRRLNIRERIALCLYCIIPLVAIILQNIFKGFAIAYAGIVFAVEVLFFFLNVEKNIEISKEEEKNKEAQIRIMISQIQPHFIYNALSSVSTLIPMNPAKAQEALDDFTEYLRGNLSSLTETRMVPFENELRHIQTYVSLEKLRFNDRLHVNFNVETTSFTVPCLSIQPIVENAIKHGILKRIEGGTVDFNVFKDGPYVVLEIIDDGVGFNMEDIDFEGNKHIGLRNIKYRIEQMGNGEIDIQSEEGKGTKVTVRFRR